MRPPVQRVLLALLVMAADAALALSHQADAAWMLAALAPAALFVGTPRMHPGLAHVLVWTSWALVAATAIRGDDLGQPLGLALGALATVFLTDERAFPIPRALMPTIVGILLASGSNPAAPHFTSTAWIAAVALTLWLLSGLHLNADPWRWASLAVFLAIAAAIAHGLILFLPWAQPHVEQATVAYIMPNSAETGLAAGGRLGDVADLAVSHRVLLRMWADRPANLRAGVFTRFDGRAWQGPAHPQALVELLPTARLAADAVDADDEDEDTAGPWRAVPGSAPGASARRARIVAVERMRGILPAPANVDAARGVADFARLDRFGLLVAPARVIEEYSLRYVPGPAAATEDAVALAESREPPPHPDPRLVALAQQLAEGAATTEEKIQRTAAHLRTNYHYSLAVGAFHTNDPVAEFLFEKKKGYCEYFATATVLLLRLQGVPARYVSGLSVRDGNRRGDHYVVRASDAHAWAEALVPGVGWVEVDSTPAGDYDALRRLQRESRGEALLEALRSWWADLTANIGASGGRGLARVAMRALRAAGPWLLLAAAGYALRRRWRRPRATAAPRPPIGVSPEMLTSLRRLESLWARAGCPRPPHRALLEHARSLPADRVSPALRALGVDLVDSFYRGAYGGQPIAAEEVARLSHELDEVSARIGS